jgi:hypothetical protein
LPVLRMFWQEFCFSSQLLAKKPSGKFFGF